MSASLQPVLAGQDDPARLYARYEAWQAENILPALELVPSGEGTNRPDGTRIGGPVWLPDGEDWPLDRQGKRMTFLAQVDFAAMPPLPDFPTKGVLQFFIARDDLYGMNFDDPRQGDFRVVYREDLSGAGRLETGPVTQGQRYVDDFSPLSPEAVPGGMALSARPIRHKPSIDVWQFAQTLGKTMDDEQHLALYDHIDANNDTSESNWRVGGHPEFTQEDWRGHFPEVDRVLLQLWTSDDVLMWGDSGQGHFAIRREDLLKRDFSKVYYSWDCY